jgi:hypothetical protein
LGIGYVTIAKAAVAEQHIRFASIDIGSLIYHRTLRYVAASLILDSKVIVSPGQDDRKRSFVVCFNNGVKFPGFADLKRLNRTCTEITRQSGGSIGQLVAGPESFVGHYGVVT